MGIVERFAQAIDDEDHATAANCLDADGEYDTGDQVISGVNAILESFKTAADAGRRTFDSIIFTHKISPDAPLDIRFIDVLNATEKNSFSTTRCTSPFRIGAGSVTCA